MLTPSKPEVADFRPTPMGGKSPWRQVFVRRLQSVRPFYRQAAIFLASFAILLSRRPDAIFRPEFFIEDGPVFYAQAYNAGLLHPLFWTYSGYLHTFPRLVADLAQFIPLIYAPLLFNLAAMALQILPVQLLLSSRLSAIGSLPARLLLAFLYLSLPNSSEIHVSLAGAHWRLAIIAFLVIISSPPRNNGWRAFDFLAILMSSLTGPFAIMLTPVAFLAWRNNRERWKLILTSALAACAALQGILILHAGQSNRIKEPLGANFILLIKVLANHVFMSTLMGRNMLFHTHPVGALVVVSMGMTALVYGLLRGSPPLRLFLLFAFLVLACSLASPMMPWPFISGIPAGIRVPGWQGLETGLGQRYWFMPMLAFVAALLWLLRPAAPKLLHLGAIIWLLLMPFGVVRDWRNPLPPDRHFGEYVEKFRKAPRGTALVIPISPEGWSMRLVRH